MTTRTSFTVKQICEILRTCASAGVAELKFGEIEVKFLPHAAQPGTVATQIPPSLSDPYHASQASEQNPSVDTRLAVDKDLLDDMRLAQLLIDDPSSYEQEQIDAQLRGRAHYGTEEEVN